MSSLSVIIPVYSVEDTLERCVESVLGQNIPEMDVILIDDGSPDHCPEICDSLAGRDVRIRVIHHQENKGLSAARNSGLDIAQGDYVTFVDSDDYLLPDTYRPLLKFLEANNNVDILVFMFHPTDPTFPDFSYEDRIFQSPDDYWLTTKAWMHCYVWNKIYKRILFDSCRFPNNKIFEDILLFPRLLRRSKMISTSGHGTYVYSNNPRGISKQINVNSVYQLLLAEIKAALTMKTMPWNRRGRNLYYCMLCRIYDLVRLALAGEWRKGNVEHDTD